MYLPVFVVCTAIVLYSLFAPPMMHRYFAPMSFTANSMLYIAVYLLVIGATVFMSEVAFAFAVPRNYVISNTHKVDATFLYQLAQYTPGGCGHLVPTRAKK